MYFHKGLSEKMQIEQKVQDSIAVMKFLQHAANISLLFLFRHKLRKLIAAFGAYCLDMFGLIYISRRRIWGWGISGLMHSGLPVSNT